MKNTNVISNEYYKPIVPKWVAEILEIEKNKGHLSTFTYLSTRTGRQGKAWDEWRRRYSRKLKYARLNGWIVEE